MFAMYEDHSSTRCVHEDAIGKEPKTRLKYLYDKRACDLNLLAR